MMLSFAVILGLILGSFANVLIHRLPLMILDEHAQVNLLLPASHCPNCGVALRWWHNIPVLSFVLLRRRCAACGQAIAWRYMWVELGAGILAALAVWQWGWTIQAAAYFVFLYLLWVLAWIDALHFLLPDVLTLLLLWLGLLFHASLQPQFLSDAVFAAAFAYGLLCAVYGLYFALTGKHGLGFGDMKLLSAIGAWLGVVSVAHVLLLACALALVFVLWRRRYWQQRLPFGPFLAFAAAAVLFGLFDLARWL
ncbi:MAG: prepilin peptidase [Formosimonas sp.]